MKEIVKLLLAKDQVDPDSKSSVSPASTGMTHYRMRQRAGTRQSLSCYSTHTELTRSRRILNPMLHRYYVQYGKDMWRWLSCFSIKPQLMRVP
jgi:hypothetical protein